MAPVALVIPRRRRRRRGGGSPTFRRDVREENGRIRTDVVDRQVVETSHVQLEFVVDVIPAERNVQIALVLPRG